MCVKNFRVPAANVAMDVCAMIDGGVPFSTTWATHAREVFEGFVLAAGTGALFGNARVRGFPDDLLRVLHSLISGTVDVDRMDYLIRDSYYCGVPYGRCDTGILIANLCLGGVEGRLDLFLNEKAVYALDDLLWSRYQLFVQVLDHKTNVALNTVLSEAIAQAINHAHLEKPEKFEDYLEFTDDHVMASVRSACLRGRLQNTAYAKALVDRRLPFHLGSDDDPGTNRGRKQIMMKRASAAGVKIDDVFVGEAESVLIKPGGFPSILVWDRARKRYDLSSYRDRSQFHPRTFGGRRRVLHYYVNRELVS